MMTAEEKYVRVKIRKGVDFSSFGKMVIVSSFDHYVWYKWAKKIGDTKILQEKNSEGAEIWIYVYDTNKVTVKGDESEHVMIVLKKHTISRMMKLERIRKQIKKTLTD